MVRRKLGKLAESVFQRSIAATSLPPQPRLHTNSTSGLQPHLLLHHPKEGSLLGPPGLAEAISNPPGTLLPRKPCATEGIPSWLAKEVLRDKSEEVASSAASGSTDPRCKGKSIAIAKSRPGLGAKDRALAGRTFSKACAIGAFPSWLSKDDLGSKGAGKDKVRDKGTFLCHRIMKGQDCAFGSRCWHSHDPRLLARVEVAHKAWQDLDR